jgi:hypothetical protein
MTRALPPEQPTPLHDVREYLEGAFDNIETQQQDEAQIQMSRMGTLRKERKKKKNKKEGKKSKKHKHGDR